MSSGKRKTEAERQPSTKRDTHFKNDPTHCFILVPPNLPKSELCVTEMGQETVRLCIKELIQTSHPTIPL